MKRTIKHYSQNAEHYCSLYNAVDPEDVHSEWKQFTKTVTGRSALDVGAGSGRDARWLASNGWKVIAAEPADSLRMMAEKQGADNIQWCASSLPRLENLPFSSNLFDLILLSAVWMHIEPEDREQSLHRLSNLLAPQGRIIISLRFGPGDPDRPMFTVSEAEIKQFAKQLSLTMSMLSNSSNEDLLKRSDVRWKTVMLQRAENK